MATEFYFNGRNIKQPGAYATITSGQKNAPLNLDFGRLLVIDTGNVGKKWGGGSGIDGQLASDKDAVYTFDNVEDYQFFLKGGLLWKCAEGLFRPDTRIAAPGVSTVLHAKAATTTAADLLFEPTGGTGNGGTFKVLVKDEGFIANGELNEVRATSILTVTDAGATGDDITITQGGTILATYANTNSDSITVMVQGLAASFDALGFSEVVSTTGTTITFTSKPNEGATANGTTPTVTPSGAAAATAIAFANGVDGDELMKGYAFTFSPGIVDTAKFIMNFWVGTYTGLHTDNIAYNEVSKFVTEPRLIASSPEFNNIETLIDWANSNTVFGQYFVLDASSAKVGTGAIDSADIATYSSYTMATGGTETYSLANFNKILDAVQDELFTFVITDQYGTTLYNSPENLAIIDWIVNRSRYERMVWYGAGANETEFDASPGSIQIAEYFNKDYYIAVHGEVGTVSNQVAEGYRYWPSLYHAMIVCGRTAGKQPQIPVTNKTIGVDILRHNLTSKEKDRSLDAGVLTTHLNNFINRLVVLQGVNTLQDNKQLFNNLGQSFQISFKRVVLQVNLELIVNSEIQLLSDENGVNVNTLAPGMVKNFTETYLESRLAKPDLDNLLLDYRDVTVTKQADACLVTYGLSVNNEINKIFFTGFLFS